MTFADAYFWFYAYGGFLVWIAVFIAGLGAARRQQQLPTWFVMFLATTSMWWAEPFGDWGAYVLFNPELPRMPWPQMAYTSPHKPWGIIPGYGWFFIGFAALAYLGARRLTARKPDLSPALASLLVTIPMWYFWEIFVEYTAGAAGIWTYEYAFGPVLHAPKGDFPLVWPLVAQIPFMALLTWLLIRQDPRGLTPIDRGIPAGLARQDGAGFHWKFNLARLAIWALVINLTWALSMASVVLVRVLWGPPSALVP
jgi:hypothetical protein